MRGYQKPSGTGKTTTRVSFYDMKSHKPISSISYILDTALHAVQTFKERQTPLFARIIEPLDVLLSDRLNRSVVLLF